MLLGQDSTLKWDHCMAVRKIWPSQIAKEKTKKKKKKITNENVSNRCLNSSDRCVKQQQQPNNVFVYFNVQFARRALSTSLILCSACLFPSIYTEIEVLQ